MLADARTADPTEGTGTNTHPTNTHPDTTHPDTARDDATRHEPPAVPGMGAIVTPTGVAFRVWAPHADAVHVEGEFNDWSTERDPMQREEHGTWYTFLPHARVGQGYKFVVRNGEQLLHRIDPYAREVTNSVGHGVIVDPAAFDWQGDEFKPAPLHELVIYEMHVGSFLQPDPGTPGDFALVLEKVEHLKRLGVNAVQLMPIAEFAGDLSWGYNPAHIFAVESSYGGPRAFKTFVREMHRHGIAVILDVVYNHFGPSDLDLWRFDGWSENDKGGIYFYNDHRSTTPWGDTRPDYGRGEVRQFIRDNALFWLDEYRVDGLRFDMTLYIRSVSGSDDPIEEGWSLVQWINREVRERHPHAITIAEDLRNDAGLTRNPDEGGAGFHAQWDANFVHPVRGAVIVAGDEHRSMQAVHDAIVHGYDGDAFRRVIYSESHDEVANGKARVPQEVDGGDPTGWFAQKRSMLAAALVFTAPGVPMIFQGQEFLQGEWFRDDVPLDWALRDEFRGVVRLYRDLIRLRRNVDGTTAAFSGHGVHVFHVNEADNVIAFQRWNAGAGVDDAVVVLNFAHAERRDYTIGLPRAGRWRVALNSDSRHYSADFGDVGPGAELHAAEEARDGLPASATLTLAPYSFAILMPMA